MLQISDKHQHICFLIRERLGKKVGGAGKLSRLINNFARAAAAVVREEQDKGAQVGTAAREEEDA